MFNISVGIVLTYATENAVAVATEIEGARVVMDVVMRDVDDNGIER